MKVYTYAKNEDIQRTSESSMSRSMKFVLRVSLTNMRECESSSRSRAALCASWAAVRVNVFMLDVLNSVLPRVGPV